MDYEKLKDELRHLLWFDYETELLELKINQIIETIKNQNYDAAKINSLEKVGKH